MGFLTDPIEEVAIVVVAVVIAFAAGYGARWYGESAREEVRVVKEEKLAQQDFQKHDAVEVKAAQETAKVVTQTRTVFRQINTELKVTETREIYRNVCIDADGIRLWNDANQGVGYVGVQQGGVDNPVPGEAAEPAR